MVFVYNERQEIAFVIFNRIIGHMSVLLLPGLPLLTICSFNNLSAGLQNNYPNLLNISF